MSESKKDCQLLTALLTAIYNGNASTVKLLLDKGAPVNEIDKRTELTPLMLASIQGNANIALMLLNKGALVDKSATNTKLARSLNDISSTGNHDWQEPTTEFTPLMLASRFGKPEVVKLLLGRNAQVDIVNSIGWTALIYASVDGTTDIVQLLLDAGANVNIQSRYENGATVTPLVAACSCGHTEVIKRLLNKGANVNFRPVNGMTVLMLACERKHMEVVKLLLDAGAEVNLCSDNDGRTALMEASQTGEIDTVKLLLRKGAQIDLQNINGMTALMIACRQGHKSMVKELIDHGADIYIESKEGLSALAFAANREDIVSLLLESGNDDETETEAASKSEGSSDCVAEGNDFKIQEEFESDHESEDVIEKKLLATIEIAIKEGGSIDHVLFHGVFTGPPRSGKDSLMKRLVGEMPFGISPSTGAAEKAIHVKVDKSSTISATITDSSIWTRIGYDDEAIHLMKMSSTRNAKQIQKKKHTDLTQEAATWSSILLNSESISKNEMQVEEIKVDICCDETMESQISPSELMHRKSLSETAKEHQIVSRRKHKTPLEIFKEALKNKGFEGLKEHLASTHSIYLTNTGGQMEFQELLPLLVSGPSVFFVTFQLHKSITESFSVVYELSDGQSSKSYQSCLSILESILQTLSSIAAMGTYVYEGLQRKGVSLRSKVFIIGTHKDLLDQKSAEAEIERIDTHLQEVIKSTSHHYEGIIQFASESQMIFAVNNLDLDDKDFQRIRSAVENLAESGDYRITSPAHWMIFSHVVRQLQNPVETYDRCYAIAQECGIKDEEEFNQALHFIHTKMGLVRYFPHKELRNFVIVDPQILFEKVTELIIETFTFEKTRSKISAETFKQMGIFSLNDLNRSHSQSDQMLTSAIFAELLVHLRIAARFIQDGVVKFFLPCALAHATEKHAKYVTDIPEVLVTFKCGYCPKGLPGSLITYLMTNEMKSKFEWELMTKQIYRNEVSFHVGPHDIIILRILPTHLEITCAPTSSSNPRTYTVEQVCKEVRNSVDKGIKTITSAINFVNAKHSFTFYCTLDSCSNHPHPAKALEHEGKLCDLKCELKNEGVRLPLKYELWQIDSTSKERLNKKHILHLICQLSNCAAKWREIGTHLKFHQDEMSIIEAQPLLLNGAPRSWLYTLLSNWMEWAPGDGRGSTNYANLSDLKSAVSKAGFGVVAEGLSLK